MGNFIYLIFSFTITFTAAFFSSEVGLATAFTGLLNKSNQLTIKIDNDSFVVKKMDSDVYEQLTQLSSGDLIIGQGTFDELNKNITITTIDYVGLTGILGVWLGKNIIFKFKNFNELTIYELGSNNSKFTLWNYSLSPLQNNEWAVFFSNEMGTNLGRLQLNKNSAVFDVFDLETGEVVKSTPLRKPVHRSQISNPK